MALVSEEDYLSTYNSKYYGQKYANKHNNWFPVSRSEELAALVADLTTDGHMQDYPKLRFDFTASDEEKLLDFENRLEELFGVSGTIRENKTNPYSTSYNYGVNSKPLSRVLIECGVPTGSKVKTKFNVPEWIREDENYFRAYIERAFSNDGSAFANNPRITYELRKIEELSENLQKYMETIDRLLDKYYGISGSIFQRSKKNIRKDGYKTVGIGLNIRKRKAIKKFHKNFNITDKEMSEEIHRVAEDR